MRLGILPIVRIHLRIHRWGVLCGVACNFDSDVQSRTMPLHRLHTGMRMMSERGAGKDLVRSTGTRREDEILDIDCRIRARDNWE